MENMDKGPTVPKWVLIVWPKVPQMCRIYLPNLSSQSQNEKRLHWASVVCRWCYLVAEVLLFLTLEEIDRYPMPDS